jgi:hypothetical protein
MMGSVATYYYTYMWRYMDDWSVVSVVTCESSFDEAHHLLSMESHVSTLGGGGSHSWSCIRYC